MIVDQSNDLWIAGLGAGVYQYDNNSWKMHGYANGLSTKNIIYLLDYEPRGRIIALTDKGLFDYDGQSWGKWGFPIGGGFAGVSAHDRDGVAELGVAGLGRMGGALCAGAGEHLARSGAGGRV